jgi:hypothetical protein
MTTLRSDPVNSLYDTDYLHWLETTAEAMRQKDFWAIDWENLIEEIEDMGRRERRSLDSNLIVLLIHLLKWQFQPAKRTPSWQVSIVEHRRRLRKALQDSPSLKTYLETSLAECYRDAVEQAAAETGRPEKQFPPDCPYTVDQILDKGFWPGSGA